MILFCVLRQDLNRFDNNFLKHLDFHQLARLYEEYLQIYDFMIF